ncbi:MAG: OmpH family outer membrane protein [bacterium]
MRILGYLMCLCLMVSPVWAGNFKVATVDLAKLFGAYPGTKSAQDKFNAMAEKKQKSLEGMEQDLQDLSTDLKKQSSVLTSKQKSDKEYILKKKYQDYTDQKNKSLADLKAAENQMTDDILARIKTIVAKVAKDKGYDLVLDSEKTIVVNNPEDLTDAVIKAFPADASADSDDSSDSSN